MMLLNVRIENFMVYSDKVEFSAEANMHNEKLGCNVAQQNGINIVKVASIYGANNVGKTCFIQAIATIKSVLLNLNYQLNANIFTKNNIISLGVSFYSGEHIYTYDFKYDAISREIKYEEVTRYKKAKRKVLGKETLLLKDAFENRFECIDKEFQTAMKAAGKSSSVFYAVDVNLFPDVKQIKEVLVDFATKIDVVSLDNIPLEKTIELLKSKSGVDKKISKFIQCADLDLDGIRYADEEDALRHIKFEGEIAEKALDLPNQLIQLVRLTTYHKGMPFPSIVFDSTGTKKMIALASYVIEALEQGRILVIDELDSSLHFMLTRAVVALFNNEANDKGQLIFTTHDIGLLDCKRLFRKEQIWFADKDKERAYLYSLADFTAKDGVRGDSTDIVGKYKRGEFGAIPEPDFIEILLDSEDER